MLLNYLKEKIRISIWRKYTGLRSNHKILLKRFIVLRVTDHLTSYQFETTPAQDGKDICVKLFSNELKNCSTHFIPQYLSSSLNPELHFQQLESVFSKLVYSTFALLCFIMTWSPLDKVRCRIVESLGGLVHVESKLQTFILEKNFSSLQKWWFCLSPILCLIVIIFVVNKPDT